MQSLPANFGCSPLPWNVAPSCFSMDTEIEVVRKRILVNSFFFFFTVFCQTSTWISHRYTYIPSLSNFPPFPSPPHPSSGELPEPYSKFLLAIYFTHGNVSLHVTLSIHLTLSSPLPRSIKSILYIYFSIVVLKIISSVPVSGFWIYALEYDIYLSLSDSLHCIIGSRFIHLIRTDSNVFLFMAE